jgi:hypothetical protein
MGQYLSTKIVYGYDIGSARGDDGWKFEEFDAKAYKMNWPDWVDLTDMDEDDEPDDFTSQAQDRLLTELTGFKIMEYDDPAIPSDYYAKKRAAEDKLGIEFEIYGVGDYTEWVMGFTLAHEDEFSELNPELIAGLLNPINMADMDYRLRDAIRVLQLHPKNQVAPRLLLIASYF